MTFSDGLLGHGTEERRVIASGVSGISVERVQKDGIITFSVEVANVHDIPGEPTGALLKVAGNLLSVYTDYSPDTVYHKLKVLTGEKSDSADQPVHIYGLETKRMSALFWYPSAENFSRAIGQSGEEVELTHVGLSVRPDISESALMQVTYKVDGKPRAKFFKLHHMTLDSASSLEELSNIDLFVKDEAYFLESFMKKSPAQRPQVVFHCWDAEEIPYSEYKEQSR